ncbi:type II toxin-antitoxin system toxin DNA ADP-ribosyl transferase DarT [Pedobacter sp. PWIIR3]
MVINQHKKFCYRIIHRDNLIHLLKHGLVSKHHKNADPDFTAIGNLEIIDVRSATPVRIAGYGNIGDYVPFYYTTRSMMLYNIVTGYYAPKVPKRAKSEIIAVRCLIKNLAELPKWFFTDGQANDDNSEHYRDLNLMKQIDWACIHGEDFTKSAADYDKQRRYQAEFLVHHEVPLDHIEAICVYDQTTDKWVKEEINKAGLKIPVYIHKHYFFD